MSEIFFWIVGLFSVPAFLFLVTQSSHRREQVHGKEKYYYNHKRGTYMRTDGSDR